jgi:response regulator RpfG family c-di-GMP phosphodiesterase
MNPLIALRRRVQHAILAPVREQNEGLLQRQEAALQANNRALEQFAAAMNQYAEQLAKHTEAVKNMASAAQELRDTVGEMNRMLEQASADMMGTRHPAVSKGCGVHTHPISQGDSRVSQRSKAEYYRENQDAGWGPKEP